MSFGKAMKIRLITEQIRKKRDSKPYEHFGRNIKVELDLSNYATKVVLKGAAGVNISNLAQNEIQLD